MWLTAKTHTAETVHCKINMTKVGNCQVTRNQGKLKTSDPLKQMFGFTEIPHLLKTHLCLCSTIPEPSGNSQLKYK